MESDKTKLNWGGKPGGTSGKKGEGKGVQFHFGQKGLWKRLKTIRIHRGGGQLSGPQVPKKDYKVGKTSMQNDGCRRVIEF